MYKEVEEIGVEDIQAAADMFDRLVAKSKHDGKKYITATRILEKTFRIALQDKIINPTDKVFIGYFGFNEALEKVEELRKEGHVYVGGIK